MPEIILSTEILAQIAQYNIMLGATVTNNSDLKRIYDNDCISFLSIEPLLEELNCETFFSRQPHYDGDDVKKYDWMIIGAETGKRKNKVVPKPEWIEQIVKECRTWDIPIFMKKSIKPYWDRELITEFPWVKKF